MASTPSANLSLKLSAQGLGPRFRLLVTVRNDGASHAYDIPVVGVDCLVNLTFFLLICTGAL